MEKRAEDYLKELGITESAMLLGISEPARELIQVYKLKDRSFELHFHVASPWGDTCMKMPFSHPALAIDQARKMGYTYIIIGPASDEIILPIEQAFIQSVIDGDAMFRKHVKI